jgi:hypothetical protein
VKAGCKIPTSYLPAEGQESSWKPLSEAWIEHLRWCYREKLHCTFAEQTPALRKYWMPEQTYLNPRRSRIRISSRFRQEEVLNALRR